MIREESSITLPRASIKMRFLDIWMSKCVLKRSILRL